MLKVLKQLGGLIWNRKKFWMLPIVLALVIIAVLLLVGELAPLAPFVYPL